MVVITVGWLAGSLRDFVSYGSTETEVERLNETDPISLLTLCTRVLVCSTGVH